MASVSSILLGLGKATRRGIKKCPKCGTMNGTRGLSCKNRNCDMVFKEVDPMTASNKKQGMRNKRQNDLVASSNDNSACKLVTASPLNAGIFSVKIQEGIHGSERRGFVQLDTLPVNTDEEDSQTTALIIQPDSRCLVEGCVSNAGESSSKELTMCNHLISSYGPLKTAQPFPAKNSVLNGLPLDNAIKHEIWLLSEASRKPEGPPVQRVSQTSFVVKCDMDPKHPLGFLHTYFDREAHTFACSGCSPDESKKPKKELQPTRCIHWYTCLAVFASHDKLSEEFAEFINQLCAEDSVGSQPTDDQLNHVIAILGQDENGDTVQVEVLDEDQLGLLGGSDKPDEMATQIQIEASDGTVQTFDVADLQVTATDDQTSKKTKKPKDSSLLLSPSKRPNKRAVNTAGASQSPKKPVTSLDVSNQVLYSFTEWLSSVTERINQTMHFQFDGHPDALVFHVPQMFFNTLRDRISFGCRKKRLPNSTTAFVRKSSLPIGTFTNYTWNICNIMQVKQIFDTHMVKLQVTRSFVENKDGTFTPKDNQDDQKETYERSKTTASKNVKIRPCELKTFLKVGKMSLDDKESTPFVIEWIPDILPRMKIGELRIRFEYGHSRNGQIERRFTVPISSISFEHDLAASCNILGV